MKNRIRAFTMPKWGIEMEEGVIREWRVEEGQRVKTGDMFVVIETDKIANDVELEFDGLLRRLVGKAEEAYPVGALIAVFADEDVLDAEIDAYIANFKGADAGFAHSDAAESSKPLDAVIPAGLSISPKAAELAQRLGVNVGRIKGSGRGGRISLQDIEQAAKSQGLDKIASQAADENPFTTVKLSAMRRTIAKRLVEATQSIPHFYLRAKINMEALTALRAALKDKKGAAPSINDYLIKASARALMETPDVNVHFVGEEIRRFKHADISVAVAVEGGLVTPVIRRAEEKSVAAIAAEMKDFSERARLGKLEQDEYRGGTFSLSNLGMYGVTSFDAVVNPPMAAILAAGAAERIAVENGGFASIMTVTLSCDHRAIDGALGGRFLRALQAAMESPEIH